MNTSQIMSLYTKRIVSILKSILGFIGIYFVSAIIGELFVIIILTCNGINIFDYNMSNNILTQTMPLFGFIFFFIITIIYCKFIEKRSIKTMGFIKEGFIINYLKGSIIGIFLVSIVMLISLSAGVLTYNGISNNINVLYVLLFIIGYIIQSMAEEVMCRGYLLTSLLKKTSIFWAILISSLVFVFPHLSSLFAYSIKFGVIGFINTLLFSVFVSLYMIKENNIWIICAIHGSWNYILGIFYGISVSGGVSNASILTFTANKLTVINGGIYGLEASIITTLILVISILIVIYKMKKSKVII